MFESIIDTIGEGAWFEKKYRRFFVHFLGRSISHQLKLISSWWEPALLNTFCVQRSLDIALTHRHANFL